MISAVLKKIECIKGQLRIFIDSCEVAGRKECAGEGKKEQRARRKE